MNNTPSLPLLIERFFTERLTHQQHVSCHTIASYRDTFRLLLRYASKQLRRPPSELQLREIDAVLISAFLDSLETERSASARTRNLRLISIRSFFRFVAFEVPDHSAQIQRVLAIPSKRHDKKLIHFLTRPEIDALLGAPDRTTWLGRRDYALLLLAIHSGLRLSEMTSLKRGSIVFGTGAHIRCTWGARQNQTRSAWQIEPGLVTRWCA
jgi:site-specific recombinase XerD